MKKGQDVTTEEENENESDVYGIIDWWRTLPKDFCDTQTLIHKRRMLSGMYVMMSKFKREQNLLLHNKKVRYDLDVAKFSSEKQKEKKEGTDKHYTKTSSIELAELHYENDAIKIGELESSVEGLDIIMWSVKNALDGMMQEISIFKHIKEDEHHRDNDNYSSDQQRKSTH